MSCMNTIMANRRQDDEDREERIDMAVEQRSIELMFAGEDCDPCDGFNVLEAMDESSVNAKQAFGQLMREGKFAEAAIFMRGISHTYWAEKALEQAQGEFA